MVESFNYTQRINFEKVNNMGSKTSPEMIAARQMIESAPPGKVSAYAAAKAHGLTTGAISRTPWYKKHVASIAAPVGDDPLERARRLVVDKGYTAYAAAKETGIDQSTISRSAWYREHCAK